MYLALSRVSDYADQQVLYVDGFGCVGGYCGSRLALAIEQFQYICAAAIAHDLPIEGFFRDSTTLRLLKHPRIREHLNDACKFDIEIWKDIDNVSQLVNGIEEHCPLVRLTAQADSSLYDFD